jgi:hypothetical protein
MWIRREREQSEDEELVRITKRLTRARIELRARKSSNEALRIHVEKGIEMARGLVSNMDNEESGYVLRRIREILVESYPEALDIRSLVHELTNEYRTRINRQNP